MRTEQALWFYSCHMAPCCRKLSHMEAIQTQVVVLISFLFLDKASLQRATSRLPGARVI